MRRSRLAVALMLTAALCITLAPAAHALPRAAGGHWFGELRTFLEISVRQWYRGWAGAQGGEPESAALGDGMCIDPYGKRVACPTSAPAAPLTDDGMCIDPNGRCAQQ